MFNELWDQNHDEMETWLEELGIIGNSADTSDWFIFNRFDNNEEISVSLAG